MEPDTLSGQIGEALSISLPDGATSARRYRPTAERQGQPLFVFAHGAGAGHGHPFIVTVASRLAELGVEVVTFNFPYMERRRRVPDKAPVLEACFRAVIDTVSLPARASHLFIGGKSMGGRMATHLASQGVDGLRGVIALGYPLHPPGKPDQLRVSHLPGISVPLLVVQGERDPFGTPDELKKAFAGMRAPVRLEIVTGGDHSLSVRAGRRGSVDPSVVGLVVEWMRQVQPWD